MVNSPFKLLGPSSHVATITTSDSVVLTSFPRFIYVGGAGDVKVTTARGDVAVFKAVPVGTLLPVEAKLIWATGTTATNLLTLY